MNKKSSLEDIDITPFKIPHYVKFAFLCTNKQNLPKWLGYFCFLINQLQTFAMIWKNAEISIKEDLSITSSDSNLYLKIFIASEWFSDNDSTLTILILLIMFFYILMVTSIAMYLHLKIYFKDPIPNSIQTLWSAANFLHQLVFFFPIHLLSLEIIKRYYEGDAFNNNRPALFVIAIINFILNGIYVGAATKFYVMVKTKDPLSSKNNFMLRWDQGSKAIIGVLWIFATSFGWLQILILVISLSDMLFRDFSFFYVLPYYRIRVLELSAIMQAPTSTLALLTFIAKIFSIQGAEAGKSFVSIAWLVLTPLAITLYYNYLWKTLIRIFFAEPDKVNIYQLCHKRYIARFMMKKRIEPHQEMRKFDMYYFIYRGKSVDFLRIEGKTDSKFCYSKEYLQTRVKRLLISIINKYPKNELNRIILAYFYVKYENSYLLANNLIEEVLNDGPSLPACISLAFIHLELKKKLYLRYSDQEIDTEGDQGLNVMKYVQIHDVFNEMKLEIYEQIKLQINFWDHFLSTKPDMGVLTDICFKISKKKRHLEKVWHKLSKINDPKFTSSLLMHGLYLCFVNNDPVAGEKYIENYHTNVQKYNALTQRDELTDNTLFSEENVQITMSGMKTKLGRVVDCSYNVSDVFGWKKAFLIDRNINIIMSHYFREKHDRFLLKHYNTGSTHLLNRTVILPVLTSQGYLRPSRVHIKISPIVETGISYVSILRPLKDDKLILLVRKDGIIDAMSKKFAKDMGINNLLEEHVFNVSNFCSDFQLINQAFNTMGYEALSQLHSNSETKKINLINETNIRNSDNVPEVTERHIETGPDDGKFHQRYKELIFRNPKRHLQSPLGEPGDNEEKMKTIIQNFTIGAKLKFYPLRKNNGTNFNKPIKRHRSKLDPVVYNVRIVNRIHEKDFIKEVILERVIDEVVGDLNSGEQINQPLGSDKVLGKENEQELAVYEKEEQLLPYSTRNNSNNQEDEEEEESADMSVLDEIGAQDPNGKTVLHKKFTIPNEVGYIENHQPDESPTYKEQDTVSMALGRGESSARLLIRKTDVHHHDIPISPLGRNNISVKDRFKLIVNQARGKTIGKTTWKNRSEVEGNNVNRKYHLLKTTIQRLREKLNRGILDVTKAENSISSSYLSRGTKVQGLITQALRMDNKKRSALLFSYGFLIFVMFALCLNLIQMGNIQITIEDIKIKAFASGKGFLRTIFLIRVAGNARGWDGILKGYFNSSNLENDNKVFREQLLASANSLSEYNNGLRVEVSKIERSFQSLFYKKNVKIFQRNKDNVLELLDIHSNFEAILLIVNKALTFCDKKLPESTYNGIDTQELQFILDNSFNDLLISSENSVEILLQDLYNTLESMRNTLLLLSGLVLAGAFIFIIICFRYLFIMRSNSESFMKIFFRLDHQEVQETKSMLKNFMDSIESNMLDFQISEESEKKPNENNNNTNNSIVKRHKISHKASMNGLYRKQMLLFAKICPFHLTFIAWTIIYYFLASNILSEINANQIQMQTSYEMQVQEELVFKGLIDILLANGTTTLRNNPIEQEFLRNLDEIQNIDLTVEKLRGKTSLTQSQQEILFEFSCDYFLPGETFEEIELRTSCYTVSKGKRTTGLVNLNSEMYLSGLQIYDSYRISAKSKEDLVNLLYQAGKSLRNIINVATGLLFRLQQATAITFQEKAGQLQDQAVKFTVIMILIMIAASIFLWVRAIKSIIEYKNQDKTFLQLVPMKQILSNRYLKQYLVQNSNGSLDLVKRFI